MNWRHLISAYGVYTAIWLGVALFLAAMVYWWKQGHSFYDETYRETVYIAGDVYPVTEWKGIVETGSPQKMRACFLLRERFQALEELDPVPSEAPASFRCFNTRFIAHNLATGYARAYVAERNDPPGFDRIIVVFPGGRSFMWRQPAAQIGG